jgi:uncharacterized membrane protein YgcG
MERGTIIVISIIIIAVISALVIAYYQSASTKAVAAQCDKTKKVCQVQSETTHFGGYFPIYSYYYVPFPFYGTGLGMYYPGSIVNTPSVCDNCLNKITPQDEQDIQNSKVPVSQSDLPSDQQAPQSSQPESNPNPSGSANPTEQSPPSENPSSPESSGSGGGSGQSGSGQSGAGGGGGGESGGGSSGGGAGGGDVGGAGGGGEGE